MERQNNRTHTSGSFRFLLSRRDWVYVLSLLVPFVVYDLALKASLIVWRPEISGLVKGFGLMRSDLFFGLGYALFWVGLFAVMRRGSSRWVVVGLFHLMTILVALTMTSAYKYFRVTGSTLDSD